MVYEGRLLYEVQEQYITIVSTCPLYSHSKIVLQLHFMSVEVNKCENSYTTLLVAYLLTLIKMVDL